MLHNSPDCPKIHTTTNTQQQPKHAPQQHTINKHDATLAVYPLHQKKAHEC